MLAGRNRKFQRTEVRGQIIEIPLKLCYNKARIMAKNGPVISNRQALRDFYIEKVVEAGIQLFGNEVKSLRAGKGNLKGSYASVENGEIILCKMHISPYEYSREEEYDPLRPKKLLLHKTEIRHLVAKISQQGYTLVPLKVYFKHGYAKVELGLARGRKFHDKRAALKEKQIRKEMDKALRQKNK